ncbi:hypothetical protein B0T17DRAFT_508104 [Bombardia bombarda]|uniref:Uncharacterized protein n=1 Tax=Bombardia bombarda TaxID=252184 RepID=A0AA40C547_9PEZI|nr:hypothetical protein B0T17DRAFT_508104 [Bombardia bombarda]
MYLNSTQSRAARAENSNGPDSTIPVEYLHRSLAFRRHPVHGLNVVAVRSDGITNVPSLDGTDDTLFSTEQGTTRRSPRSAPTASRSPPTAPYSPPLCTRSTSTAGSAPTASARLQARSTRTRAPGCTPPQEGSYIVCDTGFEAYLHPRYLVQWVEDSEAGWYAPGAHTPAGCVAVKLVPECAQLEGGGATEPGKGTVFDFVSSTYQAMCYDNVSAIQWANRVTCW